MIWPYPHEKNTNPFALPPGLLVNQISLQTQVIAQDTFGAQVQSWTTVLTVMAAIVTLGQKEVYQTGQYVGEVTHRVSIYYPGPSVAIINGMRLLFGTRIFQVQTVDNVQERNRVLHLKCLEINGAQ